MSGTTRSNHMYVVYVVGWEQTGGVCRVLLGLTICMWYMRSAGDRQVVYVGH